MKKKMLTMATVIVAISASAALVAGGGWRVINDSGCNKCTITDNTRKCGQCGSFLKQGMLEGSDNYIWECTFTCSNSNCGHTVRGGSK